MNAYAAVCTACGAPRGSGRAYCSNCAASTNPGAAICVNCGMALNPIIQGGEGKSKMAAGLLGIFLGMFGVHNFYLGYIGKAVTQLLLSLFFLCGGIGAAAITFWIAGLGVVLCFGVFIPWIWGLIEGIMILTGSISVDGKGNPLQD